MKCKLRLISLLSTLFMLLVVNVSAQKNEVRISYGDAIAFEFAGGFVGAISDIFSGDHSTTDGYGTFSVGYRYSVDRFAFGTKLSYIPLTTDVRLKSSKKTDYQSKQNYFVILPTASYQYLKRNHVELYGSLGVGVAIGKATYNGETEAGKEFIKDLSSTSQTGFAFQITPIGLRVGSDVIGGFVELSYGTTGFVTAGLSTKF